ncbi:hypothetical protein LTS15_005214 [Exophiala xenobiotica]|nr:hypothetical protein LTS15_005214 [Exophiala xenobiotica]
MTSKKPDPFLGPGTTPITINSTGAWTNILQHEHITKVPGSESLGADEVALGYDSSLWNLQFSSDRNAAYFGGLSADDAGKNKAWMGDDIGWQTQRLALSTQICVAFGIDIASSNILASFLRFIDDIADAAAIDESKHLQVVLLEPPHWTDNTNTVLDRTIDTGLPTNALWCISDNNAYYATTTLSFTLSSDIVGKAIQWIESTYTGLKPKTTSDAATVVITLSRQNRFNLRIPVEDARVIRTTKVSFSFDISNFNVHIDLARTSRALLLTPNNSGTITSLIKNAFEPGTPLGEFMDLLPDGSTSNFFSSLFDHVHLWYLKITDDPNQPAGKQVQWGIGLLAIWKPNSDTDVVIALTYDSATLTFLGKLLLQRDLASFVARHRPDWDPRFAPDKVLANSSVKMPLAPSLDLLTLVGINLKDKDSQPPIPHLVREATVSFSKKDDSDSIFTFSADVVREEPPDSGGGAAEHDEGAPSPFSWDEASVDVTIETVAKNSTYDIDIFSNFTLSPPPLPPGHAPVIPATFALGLHGHKTSEDCTWILHAGAQNLSVGLLRSFFDKSQRDGALAVMDSIKLKTLDVLYTYNGKIASSFLITGVLALGLLELDLSYQYVSTKVESGQKSATELYHEDTTKPALPTNNIIKGGNTETTTEFIAKLRVTSPGSHIADIADSIKPGAGEQLPAWIGGIVVNPNTADGSTPTVELELKTVSPTGKPAISVLTIWLSIGGFTFTFVQYHASSSSDDQTTKAGSTPTKAPVKRLLRLTADQIPLMKDIPLVGELPQPFDQLEYLWVEDETTGEDALGITNDELDTIHNQMPQDIPRFQLKETKNKDDKSSSGPKPPALAAGHHFVVIVKGKVVLDHVFHLGFAKKSDGKDDPDTNQKQLKTIRPLRTSNKSVKAVQAEGEAGAVEPAEATPTKGNTQAKVGPLSLSALTLQFKNGSLFVSVDATLTLGPLTFSVIGFTLEIELDKVKALNQLGNIIVKATLHGIEVGVKQGPLVLEGVFIHDVIGDLEIYSGGIAVSFTEWQILAIGQYTIKSSSAGSNGFRAVFVYGKLDGPLIDLELAIISGVRLGFGYNYAIRPPKVEELYKFPFIADSASSGTGNDPMKVLDSMCGGDDPFVFPKEGSSWFCAGMTITAFDVIKLTAVLMFDIDTGKTNAADAGIIVLMLGDGVFQMEPDAPPDFSLFYIEIIVSVELNFVSGYVAANAVLAPASHVWVPMARLTGGAAFYTWFWKNSHAGDWVVSLGGYSLAYKRPSHYPNPDRIGLNFTLGDNIQVIGTMYLAVTPKCAMAGGSLHMSLSVGPVSAYYDVMIDAFINFRPFHFRAHISLSVGVECDIDILFIHIHISISLGADLVLYGPHDFGGRAHVNFWFFGFDVHFGASENDVGPGISLIEFMGIIKAPGPPSTAPANDTVGNNTSITAHKYSVEDGLIPADPPPADKTQGRQDFPSTGATVEFKVQAGTLKIRIDCEFALSEAHFKADPDADPKVAERAITLPKVVGQATPPPTPLVYSKPMHNKKEEKNEKGEEIQKDESATSILDIAIYKDEGVDKQKKPTRVQQDNFKAELVLKSVPTALWGPYNPDDDPLVRDKPDALQNADNSTIDLVQAVRLLPPDPKLFHSTIIDFDAVACMRQTVPGNKFTILQDSVAAVTTELALQPKFIGQYFKPDAKDGDVVAQTKRWQDFGRAWNPAAADELAGKTAAPKLLRATAPTKAALPQSTTATGTAGMGNTIPTSPPSPATTSPTVPALALAVAQIRSDLVSGIAQQLEWTIRPSEEQTHNTAPAPPADSSPAPLPNAPRINEDGRTDWQLMDTQPFRLVQQLDKYYPALPFVISASA